MLGAGNVSSIGPLDALYKLFVEDQVVLFKTNPVNAYLGPLILEAFRTLIDQNVLRVVYGGAAEGAYLCTHPGIDEIHITGSDKTFDAIVWGPGAEGAARKATRPAAAEQAHHRRVGQRQPGHRRAGAVERQRSRLSGGTHRQHAHQQRGLQLQRHPCHRAARGLGAARGVAGGDAQGAQQRADPRSLLSRRARPLCGFPGRSP